MTLVLYACVALALTWVYRAWRRRSLPPGPSPYPFVGNFFELAKPGGMHNVLTALAEKHGDIFSLHLGDHLTVVLSSPAAFQQALVQNSVAFAGRPNLMSTRILSHNAKDLVFSDYTDSMKRLRKLAHSSLFNKAKLDKWESLMNENVSNLTDGLVHSGADGVHPRQLLKLTAMNIICAIVISRRFSKDDEDFNSLSTTMATVFRCLGAGNFADFFPITRLFAKTMKPIKELEQASKTLYDFFLDIVVKHKDALDSANPSDFLDLLLVARDKYTEEYFDDERIALVVMDMFLGGADTSAASLEWIILLMANRPDIQDRVFKEISREVKPGELVTFEDSSRRLPYLTAVIKECSRYRTIVPINRRTTTCDVSVGGHRIPKDTLILNNVWRVHHDERYWSDPNSFNPDRFLELSPEKEKKNFLPFGIGFRQCVGMSMGQMEITLACVSIFGRCRIARTSPELLDETPMYGHVMLPRPYNVKIYPRESTQ